MLANIQADRSEGNNENALERFNPDSTVYLSKETA